MFTPDWHFAVVVGLKADGVAVLGVAKSQELWLNGENN